MLRQGSLEAGGRLPKTGDLPSAFFVSFSRSESMKTGRADARNLKLKAALIERCGTLVEANLRLGLPRKSERLSQLINGRRSPKPEEMRKIAWLCQRSIEDLFGGNNAK